MKVVYPKKKKEAEAKFNKTWLFLLLLLLLIGAFLAGMFFYRGGYATSVLESLRNAKNSEAFNAAADELNTELRLYQSNGLATVFLDIPFDSMMQIEAKREEALKVGILLSSDDD